MGFLSNDLLMCICEHVDVYDFANEFPVDDLKDLQEAGYFSAFVSEGYGGAGLSLEEIAAEQARFARVAPGIALGINVHQIIVGLGHHLLRNGNPRGEITLRDVVASELYGFGIFEPGNDLVLFGSIMETLPDSESGYSFEGVKIFTSLVPVRTCLMISGHDDSGEDGPRPAFAILERGDGGFSVKDDWNTLGMRTAQSNTMILEGTYAPEDRILICYEPGPPKDLAVFGILSYFEILPAAIYMDIGEHAIEVAAKHAETRRSMRNQSVYANDPGIRWGIAEAVITMSAAGPQIREFARDVEGGIDWGPIWMSQLSAVKNAAVGVSLRAAERPIRACGGGTYYNGHELPRPYQDALAGLLQPSDQESLHGAWAKVVPGPVVE